LIQLFNRKPIVKSKSIAVLIGAFIAAPAFADDSHHPEEGPAAAATIQTPAPPARPLAAERAAPAPAPSMSMAHMHAMMERMQKAATPEERMKIMHEHKASMSRDMMGGEPNHAHPGK
jgi:hypothetical protein